MEKGKMLCMKIRTPYYYKNFKCIAGACTDTCCAGWDVDVDEASYEYYKSVGGKFGERLKSVMVPEEEGGCTFTLTKDKRCPFLNEMNLCDLYTELGEEHLCDTCAEFPRFINEYGSVREIGTAPSCITAGELMFADRQRMHFDEREDGRPVDSYNDIDAYLYMQLNGARKVCFDIIDDEGLTTDEVCLILLEFGRRIQKNMDDERDDLIGGVAVRFRDKEYRRHILERARTSAVRASLPENKRGGNGGAFGTIGHFFDSFKGMEVINRDWLKYVELQRAYEADRGALRYAGDFAEFREYYRAEEFRYRQLLDYYVYRYFVDAVYDIELMNKIKNAVVGYMAVRQLSMVTWYANGKSLSFAEFVDIAHLYSRQFEHSYTNYEVYSGFFQRKRCYSVSSLERILTEWGL